MAFDAGSVESRLTIDTSSFDRSLADSEARVKAFEDGRHEVKISAVFDTSSLSRARQQFAQLDQQVSKDAMSRLRSSPQGSVLGALNALFSPHPVTGAPSASQAAQQGLLGKIISQPGGGTPGTTGGSVVQDVLGSGSGGQSNASNITTTDRVNTVGLPTNGNISTEDRVNVTGLPTSGGTIVTEDKVKTDLDTSGVKAEAAQAGKDAADAADDALTKEAKSKGSGWFSGFLDGITAMVSKAGSGGGNGNSKNGSSGNSAGALDSGLIGGIGPGIAGISTKVAAIGTAVATALAALPALAGIAGTGLGVALIGGAVAAVVAESPKLKAQFTSIGTDIKTVLTAAAGPIIPALSAVLNQVPGLVKQLQAPLAGIFKTVAPQIQGVFSGLIPILNGVIGVMQAAAPAFGPFIEALEKLAGNIFPGIETVVKATVPVISQFGTILGQLGSNLGGLFADAAPAIQASMTVLSDLLSVVGGLLPILTQLGDIFATALAPIFTQFGAVVKALEPVLLLVGQVLANLAQAVVGDLVAAFGAVATAIKAATPGLTALANGLKNVFTVMENAGVFAILGDSLENLAGPIGTLIGTLASGLVPILTMVVNFVAQLSTVIVGQLTSAIIQLLPSITQLATVALAALAAVLPAVLPLLVQIASVLTSALAATIVGIATALTAVVTAIPPSVLGAVAVGITAVVVAMKLWGAATALLSTGIESTLAGAVGGMIGTLKEFQLATEGVTLAEKAQLAGMLAIDALGPGILIGITAAVAALGVALVVTNAQAQTIVGEFAAQNQQIGYNIAGYTKLAATIDTASAGYANFAQKSTDAVRGGAAGAQQLSQQLSGQALAVAEEAGTMQTRLTALSSGLGVSQKTIEQWASAAGISATKFAGAGENVGLLTNQIVGFVNKNAAAVTSTASLGTNIAIFGNDVFSATTQLDAFNGIWNTLVGNLLTKQEALSQAKTSFDNLKQTIAQTGSASDQSQQSFQQYVQQVGSAASALEKGGASVSTVNSYLQTQIDHLGTLGPLNKDQQADLAGLKAAQDAYANSTNGLNTQQKTLISQFETGLIPSLQQMGADTPTVTSAIGKLANSIIQTGNNSASTKSDRAQLIADLANVGVKGQASTTLVNGLQKQIDALKGKVVAITANVAQAIAAVSSFQSMVNSLQGKTVTIDAQVIGPTAVVGAFLNGIGAATGGLVSGPGGPTDDAIPAWLSNGEYVISAGAVSKYGKGFLDDVNAMELAGGGMVANYGASYSRTYALGRASAMAPAGGKTTDDLAARLDQLHADMREMVNATRAVPAGVGAHVGGVINGAAHDASFNSRYPRGGA